MRRMTPLHHVAQRGNCQLAALLLSHGADLDARCSNGHAGHSSSDGFDRNRVPRGFALRRSTALHQAASSIAKGKLELLQLLVTEVRSSSVVCCTVTTIRRILCFDDAAQSVHAHFNVCARQGSATCLEVPDNFGCADRTRAMRPSASAPPSCCSRMALDLVDDRSVLDKVAVLSDTLLCPPLVCAARILLRRHTSARLVRALNRDGNAAALLQTLATAASRQAGQQGFHPAGRHAAQALSANWPCFASTITTAVGRLCGCLCL